MMKTDNQRQTKLEVGTLGAATRRLVSVWLKDMAIESGNRPVSVRALFSNFNEHLMTLGVNLRPSIISFSKALATHLAHKRIEGTSYYLVAREISEGTNG